MVVALGTAMMIVGAIFEVLDMSVCAIASMLVRAELGLFLSGFPVPELIKVKHLV